MILEVVVEKIEELNAIQGYHIDRVELVSALDVGGLTPSALTVQKAVELFNNVQVMIRPRSGGFCYSEEEISYMCEEIIFFANYGIKGVVFGCLDRGNQLDKLAFEKLFKTANELNLESTFHRAIDFCTNKVEALEFLKDIGVNRLLSAGSTTTIEVGYEGLKFLLDVVENKIKVIAAGGISIANVLPLLELNTDIHIAVRKKIELENEAYFGGEYEVDYFKLNYFSSLAKSN